MIDTAKETEFYLAKTRSLFERDGHVDPVAFFVNKDEQCFCVPPSTIQSIPSKDLLDTAFVVLAKKVEAILYVHIFEAWAVQTSGEDVKGPVREHPDRIDVVMVTIEDTKSRMSYMAEITVDGDKKLLGPWRGGPMEGRFHRVLPQHDMNKV